MSFPGFPGFPALAIHDRENACTDSLRPAAVGGSHTWPHETTRFMRPVQAGWGRIAEGSYSVGPLPGGEELAPLELLPDAGSDDPLVGAIDVPEEE